MPLTTDQLAARKIGGSSVPMLLGCYGGPKALFDRMTGQSEPVEQNLLMRLGDATEGCHRAILETESGYTIYGPEAGKTDVHPDYPWMTAHPDGTAYKDGQHGIIELKFTTYLSAEKRDLIYPAQLLHNMIVCDCTWGLLSVLGGKDGWIHWRVERDEEQAAQLIELEARFYKMVQEGIWRENWQS